MSSGVKIIVVLSPCPPPIEVELNVFSWHFVEIRVSLEMKPEGLTALHLSRWQITEGRIRENRSETDAGN